MADFEKTIKLLETAMNYNSVGLGRIVVHHDTLSDALELLKSQPQIVRCKDCKHRPIKPEDYENGFDLEFPDGVCPCQCDDGWYSWYPADNWFCADGERKEGDK